MADGDTDNPSDSDDNYEISQRPRGSKGTLRGRSRGTSRTPSGRGTSHGRARGRETSRAKRGSHSRGTTRGRGHTPRPNPLGEWKKAEPHSYCYGYYLTPGATGTFAPHISPLELFCKFFTDEVWDLMMVETNRYAGLNLPGQQYASIWDDVTVDDMKTFVGLLILMGILRLPRIEMYWSNDC